MPTLQTKYSKAIILLLMLSTIACQNNSNNPISDINSPLVNELEKVSPNQSVLKINESLLQLNAQEGLVYYQNKPFTGTGISYYPQTQTLAKSIDYQEGVKHGYYKKWFDSGLLSFESSYTHGKQHGLTKSWWRNGNLRSESNFVEGIGQGTQLQWYKSGAKFKRLQLVDGKEQGLQQSWRENGKIYNNYEAKNGRIFGLKRANLCYALEDEKVVLSSK